MNRRDILKFSAVAAIAKAGSLLTAEEPPKVNSADRSPGWIPSESANSPMGVAKGIVPGRVVWVRDPAATPWDGDVQSGHWWETGKGVNQEAVNRMLSRSLQALTGTKSDARAWKKLFTHFNSTHRRGNTSYKAGEMVALKINCNNCYDRYGAYNSVENLIDAAPQPILAMLDQLVTRAGVPQEKILVFEAVRVIPDRIYKPCHEKFPRVLWMDSEGNGTNHRLPVDWHHDAFSASVTENNQLGTSVPELIFQSTYIINMSLLKGHPTCGVTMTAKNHYGSINGRDHNHYINTWQHKMGIYNPFVDLIGTKQLGGKTLFIHD